MIQTATVTWITYRNFGTFLQAYALQQTLKSMGVANHIIDDRSMVYASKLRMYLSELKCILMPWKDQTRRFYKKFAHRYLLIDSRFSCPDELNNRYDIFICGSDQIWSPYLKFKGFYYLDFTQKKKIAYAPSTGTGTCSETYQHNVKSLIERFDAVSVREEDGMKMLSSFLNKDVCTVLDPTLLVTTEQWESITYPIKETDYILCYFLTPNLWYMNYVKEYAKKKGLKLFIFATNPEYSHYGDSALKVGPDGFLSYIRYAKKVFTDSYHASIFSILFRKDFVTFERFAAHSANNQNTRVENLFQKFRLQSYFVGPRRLNEVETLPVPSYEKVFTVLEQERNKSLDFLRSSLFNN